MLTLICGIPNTGKTTYSSCYGSVIHFDDFHNSFERCNRAVARAMGDVCVEGVYNSVRRRKELLEACGHQDRKVCIWLDTPLEECIKREANYRHRPLGLVHAHYNGFEPPTVDEGWDEVIIITPDVI